jgi:hypothetical protein
MKSAVSCFLALLMLLGSLVPQNDLTELTKMPQLVRHYRFHQSPAAGGLTMLQFLAEHYGAGTRHYDAKCGLSAQHQQNHHDLPLRCHHDCQVVAFVLPSAQPVLPVVAPAADFNSPRYGWGCQSLYAFRPATALLQPPRA